MRLKEFFFELNEEEKENENKNELHKTETINAKNRQKKFTPQKGRNLDLDPYIEIIKNDIIGNIKKTCNMNITSYEEKAIKEILNNDSIVVRPADKGSGVVIVDTDEYWQVLLNEVKNSKSYLETEKDMTEKVNKQVRKIANKMEKEGFITKEMKKYLTPHNTKAGKLKGNPKIHKPGNKYREIVDGKGNATENMAEICEKELNEFVITSPSYIKDTTDFLNKLKTIDDKIPVGSILFCLDVVKLYPSIPKKEGLKSCGKALEMRKNKTIPTEYVLTMIKTVLEGNNFNLCIKRFIQTDGVAIGSKLGKNWDNEALKVDKIPIFYKRFIDDGFGIWTYGIKELKKYTKIINEIHPNIKVELRWNYKSIEFLDTIVTIEGNKLQTTVYRKPTDKHLFVHMKSNHPTHVKKAILYGQAIRLKRICSSESEFETNKIILKRQLRLRGYSGKFIDKEFEKVNKMRREDLLVYKDRKQPQNRVPLVLMYDRHLPDIHAILKRHQHLIEENDELKQIFLQPPLVAYKRDQNLADILVHGKLNKITKQNTLTEHENCVVCDKVPRKTSVTSNNGKQTFKIKPYNDCKTKNLVYAIECTKCSKTFYIGETGRSFKERMMEHLKDIQYKRNKPISDHFNNDGHDINNFKCHIIEQIYDQSIYYRKLRECTWIDRLETRKPNGINSKTTTNILWTNYKDND